MPTPEITAVRRRARFAAATGFALALSTPVSAHLRWFVDADSEYADLTYGVNGTNLLIVIGAALFAGVMLWVHHASKGQRISNWLERAASVSRLFEWRMVAFLTGVMLIGCAATGVFLAPNIGFEGTALAGLAVVLQVLVGTLLVLQISFTVSGVLVIVVAAGTLVLVPMGIMVDYVAEFIALALCLILVGPAICPLDRKLAPKIGLNPDRVAHLPVSIIRIGVGLSLVVLAIHNKLLNPGLTVAFLGEYGYNFMPSLGFTEFTDLHFAFAAAVAELTFGVLLVFGIATRLTVTCLASFFITTMILLGPVELLGHLPLIGIAVLLILRGGGRLTPLQPESAAEAVPRTPLPSPARA